MKVRDHKVYFLPLEMAKTAWMELKYKTVCRLEGKPAQAGLGREAWWCDCHLGRTGIPGVRTLPKSELELKLEYGEGNY